MTWRRQQSENTQHVHVQHAIAALSPIIPLNLQEKVKKVSWKLDRTLISLRVDSNNNDLLSKQRRCLIKNNTKAIVFINSELELS